MLLFASAAYPARRGAPQSSYGSARTHLVGAASPERTAPRRHTRGTHTAVLTASRCPAWHSIIARTHRHVNDILPSTFFPRPPGPRGGSRQAASSPRGRTVDAARRPQLLESGPRRLNVGHRQLDVGCQGGDQESRRTFCTPGAACGQPARPLAPESSTIPLAQAIGCAAEGTAVEHHDACLPPVFCGSSCEEHRISARLIASQSEGSKNPGPCASGRRAERVIRGRSEQR